MNQPRWTASWSAENDDEMKITPIFGAIGKYQDWWFKCQLCSVQVASSIKSDLSVWWWWLIGSSCTLRNTRAISASLTLIEFIGKHLQSFHWFHMANSSLQSIHQLKIRELNQWEMFETYRKSDGTDQREPTFGDPTLPFNIKSNFNSIRLEFEGYIWRNVECRLEFLCSWKLMSSVRDGVIYYEWNESSFIGISRLNGRTKWEIVNAFSIKQEKRKMGIGREKKWRGAATHNVGIEPGELNAKFPAVSNK